MGAEVLRTDVLIVGGGPAGLAAGIALRQRGFGVMVADLARPPIDKACGEVMSRILLAMENRAWLRRRALHALAATSHLLDKLLAAHAGAGSPRSFGLGNILRLGGGLLAAHSLCKLGPEEP